MNVNPSQDGVTDSSDPRAMVLVVQRMVELLDEHDALRPDAAPFGGYQGMIM
jgi:hypothetical protein